MRKLTTAAFATALLLVPGVVKAQSASIQALATVQAPISVANEQDLQFGDVIPGFPTTVAPSDPDAGRFLVSGAGALEVTLDFGTLPSELGHVATASTLPLSFGAGSAGTGTSALSVGSTFDPSSTLTTNLSSGSLYVFLGGTVSPAVGQEAGDYDGTVTLTVAYTGN